MKKLFWLFACLAALALLGLLFGLRSYRVFTEETLVAAVRCETAPKSSAQDYFLEITWVRDGAPGQTERFPMRGEQWAIGGDILKWHPWLNLFGIRNCHKVTRLAGRYLKAEDEAKKPRSVYDLHGGTDWIWRLLYRIGAYLPLVEAVYGNAAYQEARPGVAFGLYVTPSGYLVKPLPKKLSLLIKS
ncbi:MAG: hypothetical protein HYS41_07535 [Candidatus Omnitrophica bacterium]|nr:hypothetical protein [Candidatus Omnitrophota bacterium]